MEKMFFCMLGLIQYIPYRNTLPILYNLFDTSLRPFQLGLWRVSPEPAS